MFYEKVSGLENLRALVAKHLANVVETDRAEADLIAISFQSKVRPERHIYISFYDERTFDLDLEDWTTNDEWDHAFERHTTTSVDEALKLIQNWLD